LLLAAIFNCFAIFAAALGALALWFPADLAAGRRGSSCHDGGDHRIQI
jgi:hypothetical protein